MKGGWESVSRELRDIIERSCTAKQIEVMKLIAAGYKPGRIARILDVDEKTVRGRIDRAERKIRQEVAALRGIA